MNLLEWLKERKGRAQKKRKQNRRDQLALILREMRSTDNKGLLLKQLIGIPDVRTYTHHSAMYSFCDVTMHDGYTLTGHGTWDDEIIRDAIYKVVTRLKEKHGLLQS